MQWIDDVTKRAVVLQVKGEKLIRAANGIKGVATVALRPSGIFGEGDPLLVPITVDKAKAGKMKFMIGDGKNLMDFTYVGNVALAHIMVRHTCPEHALYTCPNYAELRTVHSMPTRLLPRM